ncbi:hypothetical protein [Saccharothrix variisporea]|uniref:hypothetical protein n=1 Tax=Saccharothrix variisporea TaxID=543527 RepID=UPI0011C3F222|nr:hypothetical protein [Saccharothrix variisporea]
MAVRLSPVRWALVLLVLGLAGIAAAVAFWWPAGSTTAHRTSATVVTPAPCGGRDAYDRVELKVGDQTRTARLDGCGHQESEVVEVVVPADTSGDLTVQAATSAPSGMPLETRLAVLLTCLSGMAGGLYAHLIGGRHRPQATASADAV